MNTRICIYIHDLRCGGAERVAAVLAAGLLEQGYEVTLMTSRGSEAPFYELPDGVQIMPLNIVTEDGSLGGRLKTMMRAVYIVKEELKRIRPDVVIGFMTEANIVAVLAGRIFGRFSGRIIGTEHVHPAFTPWSVPARLLRMVLFPLLDAVVPVSSSLSGWYKRWLAKKKVYTITNPVVLDDKKKEDSRATACVSDMVNAKWVLAMGRLHSQKGFDNLLEAFASIPETVRNGWKLGIIGEGDERDNLCEYIKTLHLENEVVLFGRFYDPFPVLRNGELFCLSSRYEGFAIALAEAMACGLPAVAYDCPSGPADIIRDSIDGLLVPANDIDKLKEALTALMKDSGRREKMAQKAPEVLERFNRTEYVNKWCDLLEKLCAE